MGVFQSVVTLLYRSLLFLIRLPRPVFSFITRLFGVMDPSPKSLTQKKAMGNSNSSSNENDPSEQYDSTWEDEQDHEDTSKFPEQSYYSARRNIYAAQDMKSYRHYYQVTETDNGTDDDLDDQDDGDSPNVQFYRNKMPFHPDRVYIDEFHQDWCKDYHRLEYVHSYIQWLFPIQEKGMNYESQELSIKEIKLFRRDAEVKRRLLTSYKLMLDFYGIELVSEETADVKRAENWRARFENLNRNAHNNLRITRIIKSLGLLGFRHYQKPLVQFFLQEALVNCTLPRVKQSVLDYFIFAVLDKHERKELIKFAFFNFKPREKFVWCPRRIRNKFLKEEQTASHNSSAALNEGVSSDSSSQKDQDDPLNNTVQYKDETKTDTNEDTGYEKSLGSESRNDGNVSDSEKQALPVTAAVNANTSDTNEAIQVPTGADSEHGGHIDSEDKAPIQKGDDNAGNEKIPNSVQKVTEKLDESSSEDADSSKGSKLLNGDENVDSSTASDESTHENLKQTPSGTNLGPQDSKDEFKSQHTDQDRKENDSEEIQKSGSESPEEGVAPGTETDNEANSAHNDAEASADKNSPKCTLSPEVANTSSRHFEQESEENRLNQDNEGSEPQNQCDDMLNQLRATTEAENQKANEKKEDPVQQSNGDNTEDGLQSRNNNNSDTAEVKNGTESEQGTEQCCLTSVV